MVIISNRISKAAKEKLAMKSGSGVSLPLHWSNMENKNCKLVSLDCQKPEERAEFSTVSSMIENGLSNAVVKEVIRVQNEYLWQIYSVYVTVLSLAVRFYNRNYHDYID